MTRGWLLGPPRRWALRELKVHPGQVVVAVGYRAPWTLPVLRDLVGDVGAVYLLDNEQERASKASASIDAEGWSNVTAVAGGPRDAQLPRRADRLLIDDDGVLASRRDVERLTALLEPSGRVAAVCRGRNRPWAHLEERMPYLRREPFFFRAAHALWGQVP